MTSFDTEARGAPWPASSMTDDLAFLAHALERLVADRLPATHHATGDDDAWPVLATALLSRATTTLGSIMHLRSRGQMTDAGTLLRSLYEHLVHLALLATKPDAARLQELAQGRLEVAS